MLERPYEHIYTDFLMHNPWAQGHVGKWYASGVYEITIFLDDGNWYTYDQASETFRMLSDARCIDTASDAEYKHIFSEHLRRKIQERGITQLKLSTITGIPQTVISKYINGTRLPGLYYTCKLAAALECSVSELAEIY